MIDSIQLSLLNELRFSLFGGAKPTISNTDISAVINEAKAQAVFPLIYLGIKDEIKNALTHEQCAIFNADYFSDISNSVRIQMEHDELHRIMETNNIPYVVLKGSASAAYYPDPELREMGDVDFLVKEDDVLRGIHALEKNGFHRDQYEFTTNQSAYLRPPMTTWEIHKEPTGIPRNDIGDLIRQELSTMIEDSKLYNRDGVVFNMPNIYHHGIVLLLHKISHMTSTGIGLRHLCDWAVFESALTNDEFIALFEGKLKCFGIWKFAQIMTLLCEKYLGAPKRAWAQNKAVTAQQLEALMLDIFSAGNFGKKDANRQREIKYLTDRKEGKLGNKNLLFQAVISLNEKVYAAHPSIKKYKLLLPGGWAIEGGKYINMLIHQKRKNKATTDMLREASHRKKLYRDMELFLSKEK